MRAANRGDNSRRIDRPNTRYRLQELDAMIRLRACRNLFIQIQNTGVERQ